MPDIDVDNILKFLRMSNVFGGDNGVQTPPYATESQSQPVQQSMPMQQQMPVQQQQPQYQPHTEMSDQYSQVLQNLPQHGHPNMLHKILGALAGISTFNVDNGIETYKHVSDPGYYQQMSDWRTKAGALEKGAEQEDKYNTNQRILYGQAQENATTRARDTATKANQEATRAETGRHNLGTEEHWDRVSNLAELIQAGKLPDAQKAAQDFANDLAKINVQGGYTLANTAAAGRNQLANTAAAGAQARLTKAAPGTDKPEDAELPTQTSSRILNKAIEVKAKNPKWGKYIHFLPGKVVSVAMPKAEYGSLMDWGGASEKELKEVTDAIYGADVPPPPPPSANTGTSTQAAPVIEKPVPGRPDLVAVSSDGGKTWKAQAK